MMFLISGCCVMDSKFSTASINISLNSGSERKLTQLIVEDVAWLGCYFITK
jgi:hypothetical protein